MNLAFCKAIQWPAILVYSGDEELGYIESQLDWESDPDFINAIFQPEDRLIDSLGRVFQLESSQRQPVATALNEKSSLENINQRVKAHLSQMGNCCVSKFASQSIPEAYAVVKQSTHF